MNDIYEYLDELQSDIFLLNLEDIEKKYYKICEQLAGIEVAQKIKNLDLREYEEGLKKSFTDSINYLNENEIKSLYFEYDMDNNWNGQFYLCEDYYPLEEDDDDWACDWQHSIEGPNLREFSDIYNKSDGFNTTNASHGTIIFLITRTIIAYIKGVQSYELNIPICIGFHDQDPIFRLKKD